METNKSKEVLEMEARERNRWLTIAAGKQIRQEWESLNRDIKVIIDKYDSDPENETEATILVSFLTLIVDGFARRGGEACKQIAELKGIDISGR